jgi:hypothetical protein
VGRYHRTSISPLLAVLSPGRRLAGVPSRGRKLSVTGCLSQCDTGHSLMPEAQRSTPDWERVSRKVAASCRFCEGLDCQFATLQAGPNGGYPARVEHHNALSCDAICRLTSSDGGRESAMSDCWSDMAETAGSATLNRHQRGGRCRAATGGGSAPCSRAPRQRPRRDRRHLLPASRLSLRRRCTAHSSWLRTLRRRA